MKKIDITTKIEKYDNISELPEQEQQLINLAREAAEKSYSPYSKFKVGVALLLSNDKIVTGNNQENAAYPSGLCAERTAIYYANAQYPDAAILKMAVSATHQGLIIENPISPCGACRQVMIETETRFKTNIKTILDGEKAIYISKSAANLLPLSFTQSDLD
ncbi:cytidine deaminase [Labilibacter sediminis]|nr:cytidine deaminase [Labilibacter sediminis]